MNHDKLIDKLFFKDNTYNKSIAVRYNLNKKYKYINIRNYILNRYCDSLSERETIYRIHYQIEITPICPICGKQLKFFGRQNKVFLSHCSNKCKKLDKEVNNKWKESCGEKGTNREKFKNTCKEKYGIENPYQISDVINKIQTINKIKQKESLKKQKQTCLKKYGVEYYLQTEEIKDKKKKQYLLRRNLIMKKIKNNVLNKYCFYYKNLN